MSFIFTLKVCVSMVNLHIFLRFFRTLHVALSWLNYEILTPIKMWCISWLFDDHQSAEIYLSIYSVLFNSIPLKVNLMTFQTLFEKNKIVVHTVTLQLWVTQWVTVCGSQVINLTASGKRQLCMLQFYPVLLFSLLFYSITFHFIL